jgi:hypothetical protein
VGWWADQQWGGDPPRCSVLGLSNSNKRKTKMFGNDLRSVQAQKTVAAKTQAGFWSVGNPAV